MHPPAMGVAPQIFQHLLRPTKGALSIDISIDMAERLEMAREERRFHEGCEIAEELQLSSVERRL
jgi:hypothetical protein